MENRPPSLIVKFLKTIRDSRLLWDVLGPIYNKRIYEAIAELYDHIARELPVSGHARVLDAGAGQGYISLLLAEKNPLATITGIDYSPMQVRAAKKHRRKRNITNCSFSRGNVMNLRFNEAHFNAAVSIGSIKHWPDGLRGMREINRILKPGSGLIIAEIDQEASDDAIRRFIHRFRIWFIPDGLLFWGLQRVIFGQSYSEETLVNVLKEAGFHPIECQRVPDCPYVIVKAKKREQQP